MDKKLNIVMIGTLDSRGGAAQISRTLTEKLRAAGHTVTMFVGFKHTDDPQTFEIPKNPLYYRLSRLFANDLHFSRSDWVLKRPEYKNADIVHCHNIHSGFFNWSTFEKIVAQKPTLWTIHDIWPLTGGPATLYDERKKKPWRAFGLWDMHPFLAKQKEKLYTRSHFFTAAPSRWIEKLIHQHPLGTLPCRLIYNSVDTDIFKPYDKKEAREKLGLPADRKIILFVAPKGMRDSRKGSDYILRLTEKMKDRNDLLFVGIGNAKSAEDMSANRKDIGFINDPHILALYYSAADVFLYPSLADSFGLVVAEAMACGTPAVVFNTDAVPEIVGDPKHGYVAKQRDENDLENGLNSILNLSPEAYAAMSKKCVERVNTLFSLPRMVDEYAKYYEDILSEKI